MSNVGKRKRSHRQKSQEQKQPILQRRRINFFDAHFDNDASAKAEKVAPEATAGQVRSSAELSVGTLQDKIRDAAQAVFDALGTGLTESVYRDALAVELEARRLHVRSDREVILPIRYTGRYVGFCRSDIVLLCNDVSLESGNQIANVELPPLVIELKAVTGRLSVSNVQQLSAYMRLLGAQRGVLINFVQGVDPLVRQALKEKRTVIEPTSSVESVECVFLDKKQN